MLTLRPGLSAVICALGVLAAACAARTPSVVVNQSPPPAIVEAPAAPIPQPAPDPVATIIALSDQYFEAGRRELSEGHLVAAREAFDRAVEVLLAAPGGARADARTSAQYDRLIERISGYDLTALAEADGFVEKAAEPASIDALLTNSTLEPPAATEETQHAVADDLQTVVHDIDIPLNARVLAYVELFTGRLKGYLEEGLSRGAQYLPMIQDVFRAEGLPLDLAYVPLIESAFKPNAVSRAKAKGMWQFMRGTALENGLKHDWYIDERADPEKATRAAAKYLKTLYGMFDDWHLALASYNGGPGRVQRAMKRSGRTDFWKLSSNKRYLPRETRDYVPLILAATIIARNPTQYGLNVAPIDPPVFETVTVASAVDLRRVAEWAAVPVQDIQSLNPELRRWTTPVRAVDYELKVPTGTATLVNTRLSEIDLVEGSPLSHYTVKKGETLLSIAKRLRVTRSDLAEANYLSVKSKLRVGQQLIVPRAPALLARTDNDSPARVSAEPGASDAVLASRSVDVDDAPAHVTTTHRVKRGETLFSIAKRYGTTVDRLREWNGLRGSVIHVGQRLVIEKLATLATN